MRQKPIHAVTAVAVSAAIALSGCSKSERWCEWDSTDEVIPNSVCEANTPGSEWEPDHDKPRKKKTPIVVFKKPTVTKTSPTTKKWIN